MALMGTKMKGIYRGFKYTISQIFVVKEREMEIGYPTDVKHVAHIGWDARPGHEPSWMNEFKTSPDFATTSMGSSLLLSPWSISQGFVESMRQQSAEPTVNTKQKRNKKNKSSSRFSKPRSNFAEDNQQPKPANIKVF